MKHNNSYIYPKTVRTTIDGKRHYDINGGKWKLPSVTTILSATQSAEKRESLANWRKREGEENAARIVATSGARGTAMHKILEKYILEQGYLDQTEVGKEAHNMAIQVIQQGLCNVSEWIEDYCVQLAAYTMAHNYVYQTGISKGVIMMCSKDNFYQEFIIQGLEMKKYMHMFLKRVDEYYDELKGKD